MSILYIRGSDGKFIPVPSIKGADGHTPQKGVDYYTEEDKREIVSDVKSQVDEDIGDIETALDSIIAIQESLMETTVSTIAFTINDVKYTALADMTWKDWIASAYNTIGLTDNVVGRVADQVGGVVKMMDGTVQLSAYQIAAGGSYYVS